MTEREIGALVRELRPVKPIPRLRIVGLGLAAAFAAVLCLDWLAGGGMPRAATDPAWSTPSFLAALFGAASVAFGATTAALASSVPGRDEAARLGLRVTGAGAALALSAFALGLWLGPHDTAGDDVASIAGCATRALLLGLLPALVCAVFGARAFLRGARRTAALALAGGVGLGAVAVHVSCASNSPLHQLLGHSLAPVAAAALLATPLAFLMGRWARRG